MCEPRLGLPQVGETVMIWSRRSGRFLLDKVKEHDDGGFRTWAMPYFLWGLEEENHPHGWHRVSPCRSRLGECPGMTVGEIASALDQGKSDVEEAEAARTGAQPPPRTIRKYVLSSLYGEIGMGERERGSRILFMAGEFARTHKKVPLDAWRGLPEPMREAYRKEWDAACAALEEERLGIRSQKDGVHQEPVIGEMGDWPERGRLRQLIDRLAVALGNLHRRSHVRTALCNTGIAGQRRCREGGWRGQLDGEGSGGRQDRGKAGTDHRDDRQVGERAGPAVRQMAGREGWRSAMNSARKAGGTWP